MLHKGTVENATLELLKQLMADDALKDFFLVGGTALALQMGHRKSIDLDLFSVKEFDNSWLSEVLFNKYSFYLTGKSANTLKGVCNKVAVDLLTHAYPLVNNLLLDDGIRMASLEDIAAMKLNAISNNGTRLKDFVDIAFLSSRLPFQKMLDAFSRKYKSVNPSIAIKALAYFDDIIFDVKIDYKGKKPTWPQIAARINQMIKNPFILFPPLVKGGGEL